MKSIKYKGFKYKLLPTKEQKNLLLNHCFSVSQTYNIILSIHKEQYENNFKRKQEGLKPEYFSNKYIDDKVKDIIKNRKLVYNTKLLQQERVKFNNNISSKIKKIKNGNDTGEFKFKKYSKSSYQSFQTTKEQYKLLDCDNKKFKILRIFNNSFKFRYSRELPSQYSSITISFDGIDFFVVFNVLNESINDIQNLSINSNNKVLGLDFNIKNIDIGNKFFYKRFSIDKLKDKSKIQKKLIKLQRKQSKRIDKLFKLNKGKNKEDKIKKSNNYYKTQTKILKLNRKIINKRNFRIHNITNNIIKTIFDNGFNNLVVEDLNVKEMTKKTTKKNCIKSIGFKNTKQMKKNILDISSSLFFNTLEYKCVHFGIVFYKIDPKYTTKTCSCCGNIKEKLEVTERTYSCEECGFVMDRDKNSSINISKKR